LGCQFPVRNTKWLKNGKLCKAILSAFYNISQRNFGILLILWCSFKLWWNFCLDQNFSYKGKGPLLRQLFRLKNSPQLNCSDFFDVLQNEYSINQNCMFRILQNIPAVPGYNPSSETRSFPLNARLKTFPLKMNTANHNY
jgi:Golgi nucleoside diphosphatase